MKNTLFIAAVAILVILGTAAILWILGIGVHSDIQDMTWKTTGVVVVGAAVIGGVIAMASSQRRQPPLPPTQEK